MAALENDTGGFRLTVARWLTPDKRWIHQIGLTPDVAVTLPATDPAGDDPVLDKALEVLGGRRRRTPTVAAHRGLTRPPDAVARFGASSGTVPRTKGGDVQ